MMTSLPFYHTDRGRGGEISPSPAQSWFRQREKKGKPFRKSFFPWRRILLLFFFSLSRRRKIALLPLTCYPPRKHIQEALASAFHPLRSEPSWNGMLLLSLFLLLYLLAQKVKISFNFQASCVELAINPFFFWDEFLHLFLNFFAAALLTIRVLVRMPPSPSLPISEFMTSD